MARTLVVVTGATGHVGAEIARRLLDGGQQKVRVVARHQDRLKVYGSRGAEVFPGNLEDAGSVRRGLEGANAVFALIPPNAQAPQFRAYQTKIIESLAAGLEANRVSHVVTLSSIGAQAQNGTGPIAGLHEMEERFNRIKGLNALHLRPGYFMENLMMFIGMIKQMGMAGTAVKADVPIDMIASQDIGEVAARHLSSLDFTGTSVHELLGPKAVTMGEATRALGEAIGKPELRYNQFPYDEAKKGMVGMGLSEDMANQYVEMSRAFNEGKVKPTQSRSPKTSTPTTIEQFAKRVFAPAFKSA
jgi:uncharacterized protein YbjT (DUF2867 family)